MTPTQSLALWLPILTILVMIPFVCYYDWKYRELPKWCIRTLLLINGPLLAFQYVNGIFGWEEAAVTVLACLAYYLMMRMAGDYFHGDDMLFACCISLFCVINPLHPGAGALGVTTLIYLIGVTMFFAAANFLWNVYTFRDEITEKRMPLVDTILYSGKRGFPFIVPISVAFILAVFL